MVAKTPDQIDSTCRYVRRTTNEKGERWEYGVVARSDSKHDYAKPKHIKHGEAHTYEAACRAMGMAQSGQSHVPYGGLQCSGTS